MAHECQSEGLDIGTNWDAEVLLDKSHPTHHTVAPNPPNRVPMAFRTLNWTGKFGKRASEPVLTGAAMKMCEARSAFLLSAVFHFNQFPSATMPESIDLFTCHGFFSGRLSGLSTGMVNRQAEACPIHIHGFLHAVMIAVRCLPSRQVHSHR
jgi:hypothetical protein